MLELPGYEPPAWLDADPRRRAEDGRRPEPDPARRAAGALWAHPGRDERSPLLVAHDGPEYADHSALLTLLGRLPPLRAALLGPVDRNETYSASRPLRARARRGDPARARPPRRSGSASARASARSRSSTRTAATRRRFDALFLQSGSFFRRRDAHERAFPRFERIARFVGGVLRRTSRSGRSRSRSPAARSRRTCRRTCALEESLRRQGYDARFHEFRDGHNWVAWRDCFHPHLLRLLQEDLT